MKEIIIMKKHLLHLSPQKYITYLIGLIFLIVIGLFITNYPILGHDSVFHLYRISMMAEELQNHHFQLPIRMLSASCHGYGYGSALFYGDIFFYIPAGLVAIGFPLSIIYRSFIFSIFFGTFILAFISMRYIKQTPKASGLFAIIYTLCPVCIYDITIRGAYGESLAYMLLPPIFCSFYALLHDLHTKSSWIFLSIGMSLMLLTHNISFVLVVICLALWCVLEWKLLLPQSMRKQHLFPLFCAACTSFLCTLSFSIPMIEQMRFQTFQFTYDSALIKKSFFDLSLTISDFFTPREMQYFILPEETILERWVPGASIYLILLVVLIFLIHRKTATKKQCLLLCLLIIGELSMGKNVLCIILSHFLYSMQFSWRLLPFISFFSCFLIIKLLKGNSSPVDECLVLLSTLLIITFSTFFLFKTANYNTAWIDYNETGADDLYLPYETSPSLYETRGVIVESNHPSIQCDFYRDKGTLFLDISNNDYSDTYLDVPLHMYKGYTAFTESGANYNLGKSQDGLIRVFINEYNGKLQVEYKGTICQKICDWISAITIFCFMVYCIKITTESIKRILLHLHLHSNDGVYL